MKKNKNLIKVMIFLLTFIFLIPGLISIVGAQENPPQANPSETSIGVGPGIIGYVANFLFMIYDYLRKGVAFILEQTIFKADPELADFYGEVVTFLASLTAIFIILEVVGASKKVVKFILIFGWLLLIGSIVIKKLS